MVVFYCWFIKSCGQVGLREGKETQNVVQQLEDVFADFKWVGLWLQLKGSQQVVQQHCADLLVVRKELQNREISFNL